MEMGPRFRRLASQSRKDFVLDCDPPEMPRDAGAGNRERRGGQIPRPSLLTRAVNAVFAFVRLAEFEILFFVFFFIAFLKFKDLTSRPEYNRIFVKKPFEDDDNPWPY